MTGKVDILEGSTPESGGDGYDIPFDVVPLPSEGKLYGEDHPLYGESDIKIKAMTTVEEDILTSKALIRKGEVVDELLKSCIVNKSVDPAELLVGDKSAVLLAVRISGFGVDYRMKTTCPECDTTFEHDFNLSSCRVHKLAVEPISPGKNLFKFVLPKTKREVLFKLLTAGDEADVAKTQEARRKALKKATGRVSEVDTNVSDRLTKCIVQIGKEKDKGKIATLVKQMPALDARALRQYINEIEPDMTMVEEVKCPHCGSIEEHDIPMGIEFLWPKRRKSVRD